MHTKVLEHSNTFKNSDRREWCKKQNVNPVYANPLDQIRPEWRLQGDRLGMRRKGQDETKEKQC